MTKVNLSIRVGPSGRELVLLMKSNPCKIGRSEDCELKLESKTVSRQHCELKLKSAGLTVVDLQSRNGTLVNGEAIVPGKRTLIQAGDEIKIGKYFLKVLSTSSASVDAEQPPAAIAFVDADTSTDTDTDTAAVDDLLSDLEQFISTFSLTKAEANDETVGQVPPQPPSSGSMASQLSIEDDAEPSPTGSVETNDSNQSVWQKPATTEATTDTVANLSTEETQIDLAEARRLEMRRRLEEMKAKDSKEAAERALKNLFKR
jgi:pSer/pThr/pTyr-binding forkhead associated (FHA) protein